MGRTNSWSVTQFLVVNEFWAELKAWLEKMLLTHLIRTIPGQLIFKQEVSILKFH